MTEERSDRPQSGAIGEGLRAGLGILTAFKDVIEETIQEAVDRGDLAPDRARQAMKDAARRLQEGFDETRERLDMVPRAEFDRLRAEVEALRDRIERMERSGDSGTGEDAPAIIIEP
jgi:polyhydroxyalkanoate synthesis regulator phasin